MDLLNELQSLIKSLQASLKLLRTNGTKLAEAEREYKVRLRKEVLRLRDEGTAIGVITLIAYGIPDVAKLRFERDVAEAVYKANQEAINTYKLQIRIVEGQLAREWGNEKYSAN